MSSRPCFAFRLFGFSAAARLPVRLFGRAFFVLHRSLPKHGHKAEEGLSAGGRHVYEVNFIKARRLVKGQPEYLIKWKGFDDDKYDTWEGLANLSGLEPDLATFEAQQKKDQEEFVKQMAARKAAKAAASGKGGLRAARSSAAVSAAAAGEDADGKAAETRHVCTVLAQARKGS